MPTCHTCNHRDSQSTGPLAPKLRKRTASNGSVMFAWWCPICGSMGGKVVPGTMWLKHREVYDLLEKHGSPFELAPKIPELP